MNALETEASLVAQRLASPAPFRAWLEGKSPRTAVGVPSQRASCPLARYLRADVSPRVDGVGHEAVVLDDPSCGPTRWVPTPPWAQRFIRLVDGDPRSGDYLRRLGALVSAAGALALLDQAVREPEVEA